MTPPIKTDPLAEIFEQRGPKHGDFIAQFELSQNLKRLIAPMRNRADRVEIEAVEMICVKLSRIAIGDPHFEDHWRDIAGYATLVADALANNAKEDSFSGEMNEGDLI